MKLVSITSLQIVPSFRRVQMSGRLQRHGLWDSLRTWEANKNSLTILQNPARFNNIFQNVSLITDLGSVARTSAPAPPRTLTAATRRPASVSATRSELVTCICQTCYKICQTCYKICQTSYKICLRSYMYLYLMTWLWPHGSRPRQCKVPPLKRSQKVQLRGVVLSLGNTIHWLVMKSGMSYDNNDDNWEKMQTTADKELDRVPAWL